MNRQPERPRPPSVGRRLLTLLLVPVAVLLLVGLLLDYLISLGPFRSAFDRSLAEEALVYAAHVRERPDGPATLELPPAVLAVLAQQRDPRATWALRGPDGALLAGDPALPPRPATLPAGTNPAYATLAGPAPGRMRVAWYRWQGQGREYTVAVAEPTGARERATRSLVTATVTTDLLQILAIVALVLVGVRRGLQPLLAFRDELAGRSAQELEPLDENRVPVEVRTLVESLNALLGRVRAAAESQQKFVADAAHQLRTPLAGMQAQLELLERDPAAQPVRERVRALRDGVKRLAHTANQLLALARAEDAATLARDFRAVDLSVIIEDAVTAQLDRALAKGIDLGAEAAAATVTGVDWLLRELLANLIDNALTYTPAGGVVTLRCGVVDGSAYLEVEDDGPGIPPEERPRVVERFQRAAGAAGSGSGLGLAIVSDIVALHRARFELGEGAGGRGTRARVEFPPPAQGL